MKKFVFACIATLTCMGLAQAQQKAMDRQANPPIIQPPPEPPPIYQAPTVYQQTPGAGQNQPAYVYDQRPLAQQPALVTGAQAQAVVEEFRTNYGKLGSPRMLIYVNRELVDDQSGMRLTARNENVETTRTTTNSGNGTNETARNESVTTRTTADNRYSDQGKAAPSLADRQTVRDVERLVGRPLRAAGVALADQRTASALMGNRSLDSITTESEQARKDREAVSQVADVALEVLISSRSVTVSELSGDRTYSVPDIQMTAIRLKDAKVIGQASASDVMNKAGGAAASARNFSVQDITEATALALMEDMMQEAK